MTGDYKRFYAVVRRIPRGRVATYGQIAWLAGRPRHARQVGYALQASTKKDALPWQRVVNSQGGVSPRCHPYGVLLQRELLEREGIVFGSSGRIKLAKYQWKPR